MSESEEKPAAQNKTEAEELNDSGDEKQQDDKSKLGDKNKKSPVKSNKEETKKVLKKPAKKENAETKSEENGDGEKKPAENAEADTKSAGEKKNKKVDPDENEDAEDGENAEGSEENDEDEDDEDDEDSPKKSKALLDLPLEISGSRERKKVERLSVGVNATKDKTVEGGEGMKLSEIGDFDANLAKMKPADLKPLHKLLFNRPGSAVEIKKNIRSFNGFPFKAFSSDYDKKKGVAEKLTIPVLKSICGLLSLEKSGSKEEIGQRLVDFLIKPEGSSSASGSKKKTPVRSRKSTEKPEKVEKSKPRQGARASSRKTKSKSYAEVSNSDEEAEDEEEEDMEQEVVEKKVKVEVTKVEIESGESDEKESEDNESDDDWDKTKKKSKTPVKKASAKTQLKKEDSRKQTSEKETPKEKKAPARSKAAAKKDAASEESSDDDEPLAKKSKKPPTDEELKTLIKKILDGANLEEITMKTVCKQVYASFPDFDLADRKEFIKGTVRSIIS